MTTVPFNEIEKNFSGYLGRVAAGESLLITQGGAPVAELTPIRPSLLEPRPSGLCAGEFQVPDNFDAPLPGDILDEFEGT